MKFTNNKAIVFLILLGSSLLLFGQILNNDFWTAAEYEYLNRSLNLEDGVERFSNVTSGAHPLVTEFHRIEYLFFGDKPAGYYLLNILIHAINAFLLFLLIFIVLQDFGIAFLSALLFSFAVGNYGKEVMYAAGVSGILMHTVFLLTAMFYVLNEKQSRGRIFSFWYLGAIFFFSLSIVNHFAFFSGIGVLLAYNIFFKKERGRRIFSLPLLILLVFGGVLTGFQWQHLQVVTAGYPPGWGLGFFITNFFKNVPAYLIHMVYPIHYTELVQEHNLSALLYSWSFLIRPMLGVIIFAYCAYGFVFGNRSLRFFIAWTMLSIIPFCFFYLPGDWINTKYLYLASAGFCLILATGTMKMYGVLINRGWRKVLPLLIPLVFMIISTIIVDRLDKAYERRSRLPHTKILKARFLELKRQSLEQK